MASHHEEQQEIENIKYLWKNGGKFVALLLIVGALGYLGYNVYQSQVDKSNAQAAWQASQVKGDVAKLTTLQQDYAHSPTTIQVTLEMAQEQFNTGKLDEAEKLYRWVLDKKPDGVFQSMAMVNLANVLLQQNKAEEALNILQQPVDEAFISVLNETKGDIYAAQGKFTEAKAAYQAALDKLPEQSLNRQVLQLKSEQL